MLLRLRGSQKHSIDFALKNPYSILALDPGMGKTAVGLGVWEKVGGTLLVVCPSYLILNWKLEIEKTLGPNLLVTCITEGRGIYELFDTDIAIVSYDLAKKAPQLFEWASMVLIDEGQELKSMKAQKTMNIHKEIYENSVPRVHILTGTPIKNRVEEFYSLIALCYYSPSGNQAKAKKFFTKFPDSISFADHFSHRSEYQFEVKPFRWVTVVQWKGFQRVDELREWLSGIYLRIKTDINLPLALKDVLISETPDKSILSAFMHFYSDEGKQGATPTLKAEAALKKVPFTVRYVKGILETVGHVPIYTDHVSSCEALGAAFDVPPIHGGTSKKMRHKLAQRFQAGELKVIVGTIGAFSTGVTLTRASNLVINDPCWVPGPLKQTYHRIHRLTQTKPCTIHRIQGSPQDKKIYETLEEKQKTIDNVT